MWGRNHMEALRHLFYFIFLHGGSLLSVGTYFQHIFKQMNTFVIMWQITERASNIWGPTITIAYSNDNCFLTRWLNNEMKTLDFLKKTLFLDTRISLSKKVTLVKCFAMVIWIWLTSLQLFTKIQNLTFETLSYLKHNKVCFRLPQLTSTKP